MSGALPVDLLAQADADAKADGLNRSELVERALRNENLRRALHAYTTQTAPAFGIDDYAEQIYQVNQSPGL